MNFEKVKKFFDSIIPIIHASWKRFARKIIFQIGVGISCCTVVMKYLQANGYVKEPYPYLLIIALTFLPLTLSFVMLLANISKLDYYLYVENIYEVMNEIKNNGNKFLKRTACTQINKKSSLIKIFLENAAKLETLGSMEYVRLVYQRVLEDVVEEGDYYITLSDMDFWTGKPNISRKQLLKKNVLAVEDGKNIHRIILLDSGLIPKERIAYSDLNEEAKELAKLVYEMHDVGLADLQDENFTTFFYPIDASNPTELKDKAAAPFVLLVSKNFKNLMLMKPFGLKNPVENGKQFTPYIRKRYDVIKPKPPKSLRVDDVLHIVEVFVRAKSDKLEKRYREKNSHDDIDAIRLISSVQMLSKYFNCVPSSKNHYNTNLISIKELYSRYDFTGVENDLE